MNKIILCLGILAIFAVLLIDDSECKGNSGEGSGHRNRTTTTTKSSSGRKSELNILRQ